MMDSLQRTFCQLQFRLAFASKKGTEFRDWFRSLAGYAFGPDFEAVRAYGSQGDLKCDGRRLSTRTVFQCYAPYEMNAARTIRNIDEDFRGAVANWKEIAEWVFVYNDRELPPNIERYIDYLRSAYPQVKIVTWGEPQLYRLLEWLDLPAMEALFGPAPSNADVDMLINADPPVIPQLQWTDPFPEQVPLTPQSPDKLARNAQPKDAAALLTVGRREKALVESYFREHPDPDIGEKMAESFRHAYAQLRGQGMSPDSIFAYLQQFERSAEPERQEMARALLAYFFERCDIVEAPEPVS